MAFSGLGIVAVTDTSSGLGKAAAVSSPELHSVDMAASSPSVGASTGSLMLGASSEV